MPQHSRMAPGSNLMRRNSSSASASAGRTYSQQGNVLPRRLTTIPLNREKISRIRPKLAKFREEHRKFHFESGLDAIESNKIFTQAIHGHATISGHRPNARSVSGATDITNDTEVTGVTVLTFDGKTGLETPEKVKRQLDPLLKARKDLLRSIGTCPECRAKKVKCSLPHHRLEDLLDRYPDAQSDVEWAIVTDADPKQAERNTTSLNIRSPTGALLETFPEESSLGTQRQDLMGQMNDMFGVSNVELQVYPDLEVEGLSDVRSPDNDFRPAGNMIYGNGFPTQTQFQPSTASRDLIGTGMHVQSSQGNISFDRLSGHPGCRMRQRASSNSTRSQPRVSHTPLISYEGAFSAPQSASFESQQYTYSPPDSLAGAIQGSIQSTQTINVVLASYNRHLSGHRSQFKCMVPGAMTQSSFCDREFASYEQMVYHIQQSHRDYNIATQTPLMSFCASPSCSSFYVEATMMCHRCGQQTGHFICGTGHNYGSQLSSPSTQSLGSDGMDFAILSYDFLGTGSDVMSNGYGVASPMSDDRSSGNGGFDATFNSNFGGTFNGFNGFS